MTPLAGGKSDPGVGDSVRPLLARLRQLKPTRITGVKDSLRKDAEGCGREGKEVGPRAHRRTTDRKGAHTRGSVRDGWGVEDVGEYRPRPGT